MTDHQKNGVLIGILLIVAAVIGVFAVIKMIAALMPMIIIGAIVLGLIWFKNKS
jgi:hypothetical protein